MLKLCGLMLISQYKYNLLESAAVQSEDNRALAMDTHELLCELKDTLRDQGKTIRDQADEINGLKAIIGVKERTLAAHAAELERLREIEAKYTQLTDRDGRGRFVKNEET